MQGFGSGTAEQPKQFFEQGAPPYGAQGAPPVTADVRIDDDDNPGVTLTGWCHGEADSRI